MKEHKHAAVLRAIADGIHTSEFECHKKRWQKDEWFDIDEGLVEWITNPDEWEVRRKQQFITVNGFKVPKPVEVGLKDGDVYFFPSIASSALYESCTFWSRGIEQLWLSRGLIHKTKEAAISHAKAMLGIDPESNHE